MKKLPISLIQATTGFSLGRLHMGGGTSAGGQSVNGDLTLIDYIIN